MILLDTHIVLASLGQVDLSLPQSIQTKLRERNSTTVSVVSIWEIAIKFRLGKLILNISIADVPEFLERQNMIVLPIQSQHTFADIGPEPITKDPFDRLLLGVCASERLKLLTLDDKLVDHPLTWRKN